MAEIANSAAAAPAVPGHLTLPPPPPQRWTPTPPPPYPGGENDPFHIGWRYVRRTHPDGIDTYDEVPLSWDDLLYPEEEDKVPEPYRHTRDRADCYLCLKVLCRHDPTIVVLSDHRIDFGVPGLRPLGPDVLVLFGTRQWLRNEGTFDVIRDGGRPVLAIEVASPVTRDHDLFHRPDLYHRAGIEKFFLIDHGPTGSEAPRLLAYRRGPRGWLWLTPNMQGRFDLSPVPGFIGLEGERCRMYDVRTGERIVDCTAALEAKDETKATARAQAKARDDAEQRAVLEERVRELEEQLRRRPAWNPTLEERLCALEQQVRGWSGPD